MIEIWHIPIYIYFPFLLSYNIYTAIPSIYYSDCNKPGRAEYQGKFPPSMYHLNVTAQQLTRWPLKPRPACMDKRRNLTAIQTSPVLSQGQPAFGQTLASLYHQGLQAKEDLYKLSNLPLTTFLKIALSSLPVRCSTILG